MTDEKLCIDVGLRIKNELDEVTKELGEKFKELRDFDNAVCYIIDRGLDAWNESDEAKEWRQRNHS